MGLICDQPRGDCFKTPKDASAHSLSPPRKMIQVREISSNQPLRGLVLRLLRPDWRQVADVFFQRNGVAGQFAEASVMLARLGCE